ncbi:MAG: hypothetical protein ACXWUR_13970 [Allosphingosinicella sp.]
MVEPAPPIADSIHAIEDSLLPGLSGMLDDLLDRAALARPGADADQHATEIRFAALQLTALGDLLAAVAPLAQPAEASRRMSA